MKLILTIAFAILVQIGFSNDTIRKIDTTYKVIEIKPLPVEVFNVLKNDGSGIEATMYQSSKTFMLPALKGTNYFLTFLQGKAPANFNEKNSAYLMILVKDDFYMDAEVSLFEGNSYIVFKKDNKKYYNLLTPEGEAFFLQYN